MIKLFEDKKNIVILLLAILFIIKTTIEGSGFALWVLAGVSITAFSDFLLNKILLKKNIFPNSAIISAFIVLGIMDYLQPWYILLVFSVLPVISKHIIRFRKKHIFNPANFALFIATAFGIPLYWNLEANIPLIIIFGLYFAYTFKKLPHILGFLIFFSLPLALFKINPLSLIGWFFIFIMLIEPKTSGYGNLRGLVFGSICGLGAFLMIKYAHGYDAFVCALFIANLFNPLLEKIKA